MVVEEEEQEEQEQQEQQQQEEQQQQQQEEQHHHQQQDRRGRCAFHSCKNKLAATRSRANNFLEGTACTYCLLGPYRLGTSLEVAQGPRPAPHRPAPAYRC